MIARRIGALRRSDPRALPIAAKLAIMLVTILLISSFITDRVVRQVVQVSQEQILLGDLQTLSRSQALRIVDALGQEISALERLGASNLILNRLDLLAQTEAGRTETLGTVELNGLLDQEVESFFQTHGEFNTVIMLDANGRIRGVYPDLQAPVADPPGSWSWFQAAYNSGQGSVYVGNPMNDGLTEVRGIPIAVPIYRTVDDAASGGQVRQVVAVIYAVWNLSNIDVSSFGAQHEINMAAADGTVLIPPTEPAGSLQYSEELTARLAGAPLGGFIYSDGLEEWLYGYVTLDAVDTGTEGTTDLDWIILTRQSASSVAMTATLLANNIMLAIGGSALFVTLVITFFLGVLLRPLRLLTDAAIRLEQGDLSAPVPELPADEVGRLGNVMRSLVARLVARFGEVRTAVQISHAAVATLDQSQMLSEVTRALTARLGYPDARIYLTDTSGQNAHLEAASGTQAERVIRAGQRIAIDETTVVGRTILLGEPQIGSEKDSSGRFTNRSELAIPLLMANQTQGAILVAARGAGQFEDEDIDLLRLIADQVAASIQNARLFEQSSANIAEIEALNRRLTRQAWEEFVGTSSAIRHTLDPEENYPDALAMIGARDEVRAEAYEDEHGRSVLAVPLVLRGQAVGSIAVTRPAGERWSRDEEALLESIAARMAVIAEGIRLVDESSRRAVREQRVNEVSATLLQRATDVESVLRTALNELGGALGSDRISLRIGPAPVDGERKSGSALGEADNGHGPSADGGMSNV